MHVNVVFNPASRHAARYREAVDEVGRLQTHFRITCREASWLPDSETRKVNHEALRDRILRRFPNERSIVFTESYFEPDNLVFEYRHVSLVTVNEWESSFAPPPLQVYLVFQVASALVNFAADLPDDLIDEWPHSPAIGCVFDWYENGKQLKRTMAAANICGTCEVKLAGMGISEPALVAVERLFEYVRLATIRRPRTTPSHVFIGHGRSPAWESVRDFVRQLGLTVEEFNQEAVAGYTVQERLRSMLDRTAFAILVMTGEDADRSGKLHARENVIHEIGLFQGRLGFSRAIVLREAGVEQFSNILGINFIEFPRKDFRGARKAQLDVQRALEREGLLRMSSEGAVSANPRRNRAKRRGVGRAAKRRKTA